MTKVSNNNVSFISIYLYKISPSELFYFLVPNASVYCKLSSCNDMNNFSSSDLFNSLYYICDTYYNCNFCFNYFVKLNLNMTTYC